jgi:hypothetical protein
VAEATAWGLVEEVNLEEVDDAAYDARPSAPLMASRGEQLWQALRTHHGSVAREKEHILL